MSEEYMIRLQEEREAREDIDEPFPKHSKNSFSLASSGKDIYICEAENEAIEV